MILDKFKEIFEADWIPGVDFISATIARLNLPPEAKILDIGTGYGASACLLALHGFHVVTGQPEHHPQWHDDEHNHKSATSGGAGATATWQENAAALGLSDKIAFEHFEAENLPHPDGQFDAVFLFDSLHHIDERRKTLEEALRVAQQDGFVCVIEWTEKHIQKAMSEDGITIAYVDPRVIIPLANISVELLAGEWYNIFIIRKKAA